MSRIGGTAPTRNTSALYRRILNIFFLCLLAAAAAGTWYWSRPTPPDDARQRAREGALPTYYVRDALLLRTDETGRVRYRIHAEYAEEKPGGGALLLDGVHIEFREDEGIPWRVRAGRAAAWIEDQALELGGGVELVRDSTDGPPTIVKTETLLLEPLRQFASASGRVTFVIGPNELVADGLKAFLKEDRLELESNVHGRLKP